MNVTIAPSRAIGAVTAPPSKSDSHRKLICAGLSDGESVIDRIAFSEDICATIDCLRALGAKINIDKNTVKITGCDPKSNDAIGVLNCRESGSTLRFLIPVCMLSGRKITLTGSEKLLSRPLSVYKELADRQGLLFDSGSRFLEVCGPLSGGDFGFLGNISSQFLSGLLFALPLAEKNSTVTLYPPVSSKPYIDMTVSSLEKFGIEIERKGDEIFNICGGQKYLPGSFTVEGDYSNAAFLDALGIIGGDVTVTGLDDGSIQGDRVYKTLFKRLESGFCEIDLTDCPDLGPILFVLAAMFDGAKFYGTERLRIKESDRVEAMAGELEKCGVKTAILNDSVTVYGGKIKAPASPICGHNDHRVVMSMAVLLSKVGGTINGAEAVKKSFPDFFEVIRGLGIEVKEIKENGMD